MSLISSNLNPKPEFYFENFNKIELQYKKT